MKTHLSLLLIGFLFTACSSDDEDSNNSHPDENFFSEYDSRNFKMGFSTWPYAPTIEAVDGTYQYISENADIYSEHIDANIPWNAWINNLPLPAEFINDIEGRASRKLPDIELSLSVSLLNSSRDELASDYDGSLPKYTALNDEEIEDAYFKHLEYIVNQLDPDYLIMAIEVNELLKNAPEKWEGYKLLAENLRPRLAQAFPDLQISESFTLHNYYQVDVPDPDAFVTELTNYANSLDFVAISFYPFFVGMNDRKGFQDAFDFLLSEINKPIVFAETSHLSEDLNVESLNLSIPGNQAEQDAYLQTLLINAQENNYEYVIWWAHRDYNELWETFPEEVQDLGALWLSNGIINEDGAVKMAYNSWGLAFKK